MRAAGLRAARAHGPRVGGERGGRGGGFCGTHSAAQENGERLQQIEGQRRGASRPLGAGEEDDTERMGFKNKNAPERYGTNSDPDALGHSVPTRPLCLVSCRRGARAAAAGLQPRKLPDACAQGAIGRAAGGQCL